MKQFNKILPSFAIAILLCLLVFGIGYAHLYSGKKWQNSTVSWYIGGSCSTGCTTVPSGWYSHYRTAATKWTNAPASFTLQQVTPSQAVANFGAKYFSQDPNFPDSWTGGTYLYYSGNFIIAVSSYLDRDDTWYTDGTNYPDVQTTAIHEMGHLVKFNDSCQVTASVMCSLGTVKRNLSSHDTDELDDVYP